MPSVTPGSRSLSFCPDVAFQIRICGMLSSSGMFPWGSRTRLAPQPQEMIFPPGAKARFTSRPRWASRMIVGLGSPSHCQTKIEWLSEFLADAPSARDLPSGENTSEG